MSGSHSDHKWSEPHVKEATVRHRHAAFNDACGSHQHGYSLKDKQLLLIMPRCPQNDCGPLTGSLCSTNYCPVHSLSWGRQSVTASNLHTRSLHKSQLQQRVKVCPCWTSTAPNWQNTGAQSERREQEKPEYRVYIFISVIVLVKQRQSALHLLISLCVISCHSAYSAHVRRQLSCETN